MSVYGTAGGDPAEAPLFGEARPRDRVINLIVGVITSLLVLITMISAFAWMPANTILRGMNVFFVLCITLICGSHIILMYWYRQGDLEPKFRTLIIFNAFCIFLLCVCANLYIHPVHPICDRNATFTFSTKLS